MSLPVLTVWILVAVAAVNLFQGAAGRCHKCPPCCTQGSLKVDGKIIKCYEQKPGQACHKHFYMVDVEGDKRRLCIDPKSHWLKEKIEKENLECL